VQGADLQTGICPSKGGNDAMPMYMRLETSSGYIAQAACPIQGLPHSDTQSETPFLRRGLKSYGQTTQFDILYHSLRGFAIVDVEG